jgi:signal transduction histidine kinase
VLEEATNMQLLIDDLLHLARSDAGVLPVRRQPVDLDDVVTREVQRLRMEQTVEIDMSRVRAASMSGDVEQLRRAVRNLVHNATRHASGRVTVSLEEVDSSVVLTVDDDGPGVPDSERDRVFERFTRLDSSRSSSDGGTGLGLAITRDIVERHGGSVTVEDSSAAGARFVVRLPTSPPPHSRERKPE